MNALMMRRRMMLMDLGKVDYKHTFEDTKNSVIYNRYNNTALPAFLTVSNGNHVKVTSATGSSKIWFLNVNMSSFATNGQNALGITDTWFIIPAGATVKWRLKNFKSTLACLMVVGLQAYGDPISGFSISTSGATDMNGNIISDEFTIVIDGDVAVTSVAFNAIFGENSSFEFDFELYVNGERWI